MPFPPAPATTSEGQGGSERRRGLLVWIEELIAMMVDAELDLAVRERALREAGYDTPAQVGHDQ
jgi:hypothetical protein